MKLTNRDLEVIDFLESYKIASTSTLDHFIFKSKRVAQRRLKAMTDAKYIKRSQDFINSDYCYFLQKPKQFRHSLLITEFYREFDKYVDIKNFVIQKKIDDIIPDALVGYVENGINKVAFLEIEISNNSFNYEKYRHFNYKKYFNIMPPVFIVTRQHIKQDKNINFIQIRDIKTDLERIYYHERKNEF